MNTWQRVTNAMVVEARNEMFKPCCGYECPDCENDEVRDAVEAGIFYGLRYAQRMIAYRIRAELVCCPRQQIAKDKLMLQGKLPRDHSFHDICYWGEMGARLAEDPHSLLEEPYACSGHHPGECWGTKRCKRNKHTLCDKCQACRECELDECCISGEGETTDERT